MKFYIFLSIVILSAGCSRNVAVVDNTSATNRPMRSEQIQSVTAHTTENQTPKPANSNGGKWSQSGDPIDTAEFDAKIESAEKAHKAKVSDDAAKKAVAEAYFARGFALTEARQYASALGDYRRALKYDADHAESKKWIDQIVMIYTSLKRDAPKEGEEPPPLPFKKQV